MSRAARAKVTRVKFKPNRLGLLEHVERDPMFRQAMKDRGDAILDAYRPKMRAAGRSRWTFNEDGPKGSRRVGTRYPFAHLDEWGSVNNPPSASMRRAVARAGFARRFQEKRR